MDAHMRRAVFFAFAAFLLFSSGCISNESAGSRSIQEKFGVWWGAWSLPISAAIGIGIAICVVSWFYASFAQDDKLKAWVKSEIVQLGYTAVILMGIVAVLGAVSFVSAELPKLGGVGGGELGQSWGEYVWARCELMNVEPMRPCHIRMAEDYLEILAKSTQAQATSILRYLSFLYPLNTLGISFKAIPAPGGILTVAPLGGLTPVIDTLSFAFNLLMKNLLAIRAQQFFVDLMHLAFFPYLIAAGIFFRAMYFTRKLGGLLIALGVGFYIVLPLMYVFWMAILYSFTGPWGINVSGEYDPGEIGRNMLVSDYSFGDVNTGAVMPIAAATSYYDPIGAEYDERLNPKGYLYRGEACANGIVEPWEECGEENSALVFGTGKTYTELYGESFVCRGEGERCDTNSCRCTTDDYYGRSGNFREDYASSLVRGEYNSAEPGGGISVDERAKILANLCFSEPKSQEEIDLAEGILDRTKKAWYERLLEGWGGGFARAIPSGFLLGANGTLDNVAKLLIFSLIAPFISLMVALSTVKALSPTFGGDVEIAGLSRLI